MSDCGHTEEEHAAMQQDLVSRISRGDITPLIPMLDNDMLIATLESIVVEVFARTETHEEAVAIWKAKNQQVEATFFPEKSEDSAAPEVHASLMKLRARLADMRTDAEFANEAQDELRVMLEQHGVAEPDRSKHEDPPASTGFYL